MATRARGQIGWLGWLGWFGVSLLAIGGVSPRPARAIDFILVYDDLGENPSYDPDGTRLMAIAQAAAARWERLIPSSGTHEIDVSWSDLDDDQLGLWKFDPFGNNNVYFDSSAGTDWFFDPTPSSDSEFDLGDPLDFDSGSGSHLAGDIPSALYFEMNRPQPPAMLEIGYYGTGTSGSAANDYDLLSVVMHEMGHELGVAGDDLSGRYPIDPDHLLGIDGVEVIEGNCEGSGQPSIGYCDEHGHLAPPLALMSPLQSTGVRTLPSAVDVLVAARDSNYASVDLVRKFAGRSGTWGDATDWIGGRVPDADDAVILAYGGTTTLTGSRHADSVAIDDATTLSMTGDLAIDRALILGPTGHIGLPFGADLSAGTLDVRNDAELEISGGTATFGGGTVAQRGSIHGRGRLETNGTLQMSGVVKAEGGDLRLAGSGAIRLDDAGPTDAGTLYARDGNLGLDVGFTSDSQGEIVVYGGHSLTALRDVAIPGGITVRLVDTAPGETATIASVGSGVDLSIGRLSVGNLATGPASGQITARTVSLESSVSVNGSLTLSSPVLTTLRGGLDVFGGTLVQDGDISVQGGRVAIGGAAFDWGNSTAAQIHSLTIGPDSTLAVGTHSLGSSTNTFRGDIQIDSGVLDIHGLDSGEWTLARAITGGRPAPAGTLAMIHSGAADPVVLGDPFHVNDLLIASGGDARIESDMTVHSSAQVVAFGNARILLAGSTTLDGGTYTGLGSIVQLGDISVVGDTTIGVDEFNWGNSLGLDRHALNVGPNATLTIDSPGTGDPDNPFRGHVRLDGGELVVNTDTGWTLPAGSLFLVPGTLEMVNSGRVPRIAGQDLEIDAELLVTGGVARIDSNVSLLATSHTEIGAGATLQLTGSNLYRGTVTGEGTLEHQGSLLLGSTPLAIPHLVQDGRITVLGIGGAESTLDTQTLRFDADADTRLFGDLRLRGDATVVPGALFSGSGSLIVDAGASLGGTGEIGVDVVNEGSVSPGNSPGRLDVLGDYAQIGRLEIELGGTRPGTEYDVLSILGDAELGGILELILIDGFVPAPGDQFQFLTIGGRRTGTFDDLVLPDLGGNGFWDLSRLYSGGGATFVPEPGTLTLCSVGLALLRSRRTR